jgi:hypothetical protein
MSDELHRLLGLPDDVDVAQLRRVYEEQMGAAARSHDHTRALQLSSALDNAPNNIRSSMYPRMTTRVGPIGAEPVATRTRTRTLTRRPARASSRSTRPSGSRSLLRPVLIMVVIAATVLGVAWLNRDRFDSSPQFVPPHEQRPRGPQPTSALNPAVASALRDAHRVVDGVRSCRRIGPGTLPASTPGPSAQVLFHCGAGGTVRFPLEPGNTVEYVRTDRDDFRVIVTAPDGEFVTYNSRTGTYSD